MCVCVCVCVCVRVRACVFVDIQLLVYVEGLLPYGHGLKKLFMHAWILGHLEKP